MKAKVHFEDLGKKDYKEAWDYQEQLFNNVLNEKRKNGYPENEPLN